MPETDKPYDVKLRGYHFSGSLIEFIRNTQYERIHFSVFDQLLRCGTSVGANLTEGGCGSSKKDVINYYHIALNRQ